MKLLKLISVSPSFWPGKKIIKWTFSKNCLSFKEIGSSY